ncbi:GL13868 [Drosophila persimilis]|uniref:Methionine aminopeptidase n=1 Tax=Drosophila persimilis TaxID=7234 RepID=B4GPF0_DROPE|nr:GL13868 [Drosophila persimilis]
MTQICETTNCGKEATLQCPSCLKLGIKGSFFCSQTCFKGFWKEHKAIHALAGGAQKTPAENGAYNPWPQFKYTGKLRPFEQTPKRAVPLTIQRPDYADHVDGRSLSEEALRGTTIKVLDDEEIEAMRVAGRLGRECLDEGAKAVEVGITTDELDRLVICHGIPDKRPLEDGDLCNIDVTVFHHGFHGDLNETFFVGNVSEKHKKLVQVTHEALTKAIELVRPGVKYREIGNVIQKYVTPHGFSVVRSYCGHGIHRVFHTAPNVPHYAKNSAVGVMAPGHCFTIEPMISMGVRDAKSWPDDWTAVTGDGQYSAQFEQTLLVTNNGCEILTKRRENNGQPWFMDKM